MSTLLAIALWFGFGNFRDINDSMEKLKPQIAQATIDAKDASSRANAAKGKIDATVKEVNEQLTRAKDINKSLAQLTALQQQVKNLQKIVNTSTATAPQRAAPPSRCDAVDIRVQQPPSESGNFTFAEQAVGSTGASLILSTVCSAEQRGESHLRFALTGPFVFGSPGAPQTMDLTVNADYYHVIILFKPTKRGDDSGTLNITSLDRTKLNHPSFDLPATLKGKGK